MRKIELIVFALFLLLTACVVQAKDSGVRFSDLSGEVLVRPDENKLGWEFAELDMVLNVMDHIQTKKESSAILSLADMTTFVMKPESEIILDTDSEKESKIQLLNGKVWVNVKKMVKDGSMNIEMSQAVAGIKGTNITCSSFDNGDENRVQVLRGEASVLIKESKERIELTEGEELVIKKGVKPEKIEIDVQKQQKEWEEETSKLGESLQLNEIPETIKGILESEAEEFARIQTLFQNLISIESVEPEKAAEVQKDAERFIGIAFEDSLVLASLRKKVEEAMSQSEVSENDKLILAGYLKMIAEASSTIKGYQDKATKIMRYKFKTSAIYEDISADVEIALGEFNSVANKVDAIKAEIANNPNGKSQNWFKDTLNDLQESLILLEELTVRVQALLEKNPQDSAALNLSKLIASTQASITSIMKDLTVVEIDSSTITEMQQIDDILSDQMVALQNEISAYNDIAKLDVEGGERRLQSSLKIIENYSRVRRNYLSAQRLYDSVMRSTANIKYKTAEQEEVETLWQNISDRFQQLGIVAEELQANIENLESQLRQLLK